MEACSSSISFLLSTVQYPNPKKWHHDGKAFPPQLLIKIILHRACLETHLLGVKLKFNTNHDKHSLHYSGQLFYYNVRHQSFLSCNDISFHQFQRICK